MKVKIVKHQKKEIEKSVIEENGNPAVLVLKIRYDDECNNGHNTFAITLDTFDCDRNIEPNPRKHSGGRVRYLGACGCQHDEVVRHFPEYAKYIKWHLTSSDGPMYYTENSQYYAKQGNLKDAQSCAIWPNATLKDILDTKKMDKRLPKLIKDFRKDMRGFDFDFMTIGN